MHVQENLVHRAPLGTAHSILEIVVTKTCINLSTKVQKSIINYLGNPVVNSHRLAPSGGWEEVRPARHCARAQSTHTLCPMYPYTVPSVRLHCAQCTHTLCPVYPYTVPNVLIHCAQCTPTLCPLYPYTGHVLNGVTTERPLWTNPALTDGLNVDVAGPEEGLHAVAKGGHAPALATDGVDDDQQLTPFPGNRLVW